MALKRTAPNRATVPNSRRPVDSLSGKLYPSVNTIKPGYPEESWSVSAKVPPIVCESLNVAAWALLKPVHIVILLAVVSLITVTPKYSPLCRGSGFTKFATPSDPPPKYGDAMELGPNSNFVPMTDGPYVPSAMVAI